MTDTVPRIRQLTGSHSGLHVAVAEFEKLVEVWDLSEPRRVSAFETTLRYGSKRFAISNDGSRCAIGTYRRFGVALYDTATGAELWRRRDLKEVQRVRISPDDRWVLCGFRGPLAALDIQTGATLESYRAIKDALASPLEDIMVLDKKDGAFDLVDGDGNRISRFPRKTFTALDFAFAPGKICVSESGGSIRCIRIADGSPLWEHTPGEGIHALDLGYDEARCRFLAITWPYENGGPYTLLSLSPDDGAVLDSKTLPSAERYAFLDRGRALFSTEGSLRCTQTGEIRATVDFDASM